MLRYGVIFRILGILLMIFSCSYLTPFFVSLYYNDQHEYVFVYSFLLTVTIGAMLWLPFAKNQKDLRVRDGFMITVLFWLVLGLAGSVPLMISEDPHLKPIDAIFESISGLTTTGATVMSGLDELPKSILFYRQQLQWLGGIGIVVIAVAILPMLGVGGMQLYRAETPGPVKDSKLTPRIASTAKALFFIYLGLTLACALSYRLAGMSWFDAIGHSFSTVSIGGFSTHDASMGYFYNQEGINGDLLISVCMLFMIIAGINFALHYLAFSKKRPFLRLGHYFKDSEARTYLRLLAGSMLFVCVALILFGTYGVTDSIRHGFFQAVSIMTTSGFATTDFSAWPEFITFLMLFLAFFGACAGSTGGGIKIGRMIILAKQTLREIARLIHPHAVMPIKTGDRPVHPRVADAIWGFFGAYLIVFYAMVLVLLATGLDFVTAWSAVAATINNLGPGLGDVAANYAEINAFAKWVLCICMILGRLELFTLVVLFVPMFWR